MKLLYEYEQIIHVDNKTELKMYTIQHALLDVQRTRRYAKFYTGKYYISVTFNRDHTILISSNYRTDMKFNRELKRLEAEKFTLYKMSYFIWYWMNKLRKMWGEAYMIRLINEAEQMTGDNMQTDIKNYLEDLLSSNFENQLLNAVARDVPGYDASWGNQAVSQDYIDARNAFLEATRKELFANFEI